ncbi:MAG TPA: PH domain-containing protein [Thermomonas sp.]|nr:PH domain-containing protein [Thermomonas sp.]
MPTTPTRSFAVTPVEARAAWLMAMLLLIPAMVVVALFASRDLPDPGALPGAGLALLVIAGVAVASAIGLKRKRVGLEGDRLHVVAGLFSHTVAVGAIDLQRARIVDLAERTELRPAIKTFGMSLPGYQAGHFRLRAKLGKAFCLVTDTRRVLWLPLRDGKQQLLLSLEQPQALLEALRERR